MARKDILFLIPLDDHFKKKILLIFRLMFFTKLFISFDIKLILFYGV